MFGYHTDVSEIRPDEVTSAEAAGILGVSQQRINNYISRGLKGHRLPARTIPFRTGTTQFVITRAALDEFVQVTNLRVRDRTPADPNTGGGNQMSSDRYSIDTLERVMELGRQHQIELELAQALSKVEALERENALLRTAAASFAQLLGELSGTNGARQTPHAPPAGG